jgi:protoporphyrinogen oxidase
MNRKGKKIAIVGGGIGGLTLAYFLAKKGDQVTVWEKEKQLGGLVSGFKMGKTNLEQVYHHFFKTDSDLIGLVKEIGLSKNIGWHKSLVGLYWDKEMYPFVTAMDLLKFKPLGLIDKLRMGVVALWLKFDKKWKKYEGITADKWMKKMVGKRAYEVVWQPLLKGKFHNYYKKVSMAWLWARIHTRGNSTNEKREEVLGYIDGGFEMIVAKLTALIKKNGGKIKLNTNIKDLTALEKEFEIVVDTRPAKEVEYLGAIDVVFRSKQNLSTYYWHNINDIQSPFVAVVQHTNLIEKKNYGNEDVYYLGSYLPQNHKFFGWSDKKLVDNWFGYVKKIFPNFNPKMVDKISVFRFRSAQHIVTTNYAQKIPPSKISAKIYQMNFAQIYPEDRGLNFAVREAKKMFKVISES